VGSTSPILAGLGPGRQAVSIYGASPGSTPPYLFCLPTPSYFLR